MEDLLHEALSGIITCPKCANQLEPDAEKCSCGWMNPLVDIGFI